VTGYVGVRFTHPNLPSCRLTASQCGAIQGRTACTAPVIGNVGRRTASVVPPMPNNTVFEEELSDRLGTSQPGGEAQPSEWNPGIPFWQMGSGREEAVEIGEHENFQPDRKNVRKDRGRYLPA